MHRVPTEVYFLQSGKLPCLVRRRDKDTQQQQQLMDRIQLSAYDGSVVRISRRTAVLCAWLHGCRSTRCAPLVETVGAHVPSLYKQRYTLGIYGSPIKSQHACPRTASASSRFQNELYHELLYMALVYS